MDRHARHTHRSAPQPPQPPTTTNNHKTTTKQPQHNHNTTTTQPHHNHTTTQPQTTTNNHQQLQFPAGQSSRKDQCTSTGPFLSVACVRANGQTPARYILPAPQPPQPQPPQPPPTTTTTTHHPQQHTTTHDDTQRHTTTTQPPHNHHATTHNHTTTTHNTQHTTITTHNKNNTQQKQHTTKTTRKKKTTRNQHHATNNQQPTTNNRLRQVAHCFGVGDRFFMAEFSERPSGGVARRRRERRTRSWFRHEQQSIRIALATAAPLVRHGAHRVRRSTEPEHSHQGQKRRRES